jgi:hypothetical protein
MLKTRSSTVHFKSDARTRSKTLLAQKKRGIGARGKPRFRIGIWDIDVYAGFLFRVLEKLNDGQHLFGFTRIEATVPMGLTLSGDRTRQLVKGFGGDPNDPDIASNVFALDVLNASKPMRSSLDVDVLACVVSPMIMDYVDVEGTSLGWNFFSTARKGAIVVSAYDLRTYAARAKRPFEAALASVVLASALCSVFAQVEYHPETRGCLLDYCENRDDIVLMLRKLHVCEQTLQQIPNDARPDVLRMLAILDEYRR